MKICEKRYRNKPCSFHYRTTAMDKNLDWDKNLKSNFISDSCDESVMGCVVMAPFVMQHVVLNQLWVRFQKHCVENMLNRLKESVFHAWSHKPCMRFYSERFSNFARSPFTINMRVALNRDILLDKHTDHIGHKVAKLLDYCLWCFDHNVLFQQEIR